MAHKTTTTRELQRPSVAQFNLEHYLARLTIHPLIHTDEAPPMPKAKARSTMTPLIMKPGGYRKLKEVKRIDSFEQEITSFFNDLNPQLINRDKFNTLSLASQMPTKTLTEMFLSNPYEISDRSHVLFAMERGPLKSVEQLVHTIDEELQSQGWKFHTPRRDGTLNNQGVEPVFFTKLDPSQGMEFVKCIVVPLAPWEFTPQDFEDFTYKGDFVDGNKSTNGERNYPPWTNADKMWGYLHDQCLIHDCRHFVLTTYEQWSFGGFSPYLTTSFVSEVKSWDSRGNSILEMLTYWLLTACSFDGTIILNEVPRERHIDCDLFEKERRFCRKRLMNDVDGPRLEIATQEARPSKRLRFDPIGEHLGWQPLPEHISRTFSLSSRGQAHVWSALDRHCRKNRHQFSFPKPSVRWNEWQRKRRCEEKENSESSASQEPKVRDRPPVPSHQQFGHPIPCYSTDVDRESGRFRPEIIALRSFPIPPP